MASASVAPAGCDAIFFSSAARSLASVSSFVSCSTRRVFASRRFASASFAAERSDSVSFSSAARRSSSVASRAAAPPPAASPRSNRASSDSRRAFSASSAFTTRWSPRAPLALLSRQVSLRRLARRVVAGEEVRVRARRRTRKTRAPGLPAGACAADARAARVRLLLVHEYLHERVRAVSNAGHVCGELDRVQRGLADLERVPELLKDDGTSSSVLRNR